jgi:nucleolar protein 53
MITSISSLKTLSRSHSTSLAARAQSLLEKKLAIQEEQRKRGLVGKKIGKHVVPEAPMDLQLSEDLSESLRGLKVRVRNSLKDAISLNESIS